MKVFLIIVGLLVVGGLIVGHDGDQDSCNAIAGNGNYGVVHESGHVYCENEWSGDRFLLHD